MHAYSQRFDHRGFGETDIVWQLEGESFGMHTSGPQDAMHRWRCLEANGRVDIVHAQASGTAVGIGNARLHADPVSGFQFSDV